MNYYYFYYRGISYCFICSFHGAVGSKFLLGDRMQFWGVGGGGSGKPFLPNFPYFLKDLFISFLYFFLGGGGGEAGTDCGVPCHF